MFNASAEAVDFLLPPVLPVAPGGISPWTPLTTRHTICLRAGEEPVWEAPHTYHLSPRSSAILLAR